MFFDAHADIWTDVTRNRSKGITDSLRSFHIPRMRQAGMEGGIFVIWVDPPHDITPQKRTLESIKCMAAEVVTCQDSLVIVRSYKEYLKAKSQGKLAVIAGMEGLSAVGNDPEYLYALYALGIRHASLTWNEENALATGVRGSSANGLTSLGIEALKIMEELGMIIDVSHANEKTFWSILAHTTAPLIASHSNCAALCNNRRNLTDKQVQAIAERQGVIGMNAYSAFVHSDPAKQSVEYLIGHMEHIIKLAGIDHIAFGFDFGDFLAEETLSHFAEAKTYAIQGLQNVTEVPKLLEHMRIRGFAQGDIDKIAWGNMHRIMERILS